MLRVPCYCSPLGYTGITPVGSGGGSSYPHSGCNSQPTHYLAFCDTPWQSVQGISLHLDGTGSRPLPVPLLVGLGPQFSSGIWQEWSTCCLDTFLIDRLPLFQPLGWRWQAFLGAFLVCACSHFWVAGSSAPGLGCKAKRKPMEFATVSFGSWVLERRTFSALRLGLCCICCLFLYVLSRKKREKHVYYIFLEAEVQWKAARFLVSILKSLQASYL